MGSPHHLSLWAAEWANHRSIAADEPLFEVPDPAASPPSDEANPYTVGTGVDVAGLLLDQLRESIRPDLATDALRSGRFTVSATASALPSDLLKPGQIVQFKPEALPCAARPIYALIEKTDPGRREVLAVPFGPLSLPAIQTELTTSLGDAALAVLCLWNAQWLPLEAAARCWEITEAPASLLADIATLRGGLSRKEPVPPEIADRTGPPLTLPDDPRQEYITAEEGIWAAE
jgi:hypothetical protein